jgi:hypothetical protein
LRLPLSHAGEPASMILCYDTFVSARAVPHSVDLGSQLGHTSRAALSA